MKSLQERQQERALRMQSASKGEDISHMLETQELIDAKNAAVEANSDANVQTFVQPQFAIGPVKGAEQPGGQVDKRILDDEGNVIVDGDPASKDKSSEKVVKASAATVKAADKVATAAASVGSWTANPQATGNGGKAEKEAGK
jgi:hypothetical protein